MANSGKAEEALTSPNKDLTYLGVIQDSIIHHKR